MTYSLKNYGMRVVHLNGSAINWAKPPGPTEKVMWTKRTTGGKAIVGSFRTICHLDRLNRLIYRKWGVGMLVFQGPYNTTVEASAGTHDFDACVDVWIPGVDPWVQQRFFRRHGLGGWMRKPPKFGWHYHGFTLPHREGQSVSDDFRVRGFKVGVYVDGGYSTRGRLVTSSQIEDYYKEAFGLSGMHTPGSDNTWFPDDKGATVFQLRKYVANRLEEQQRRAA